MTTSSKAKNKALARVAVLFVIIWSCILPGWCGQNIRIQSAPGQDTIIETGPDVGRTGSHESEEVISVDSDPQGDADIQVSPKPQQQPAEQQQPLIVTPEIKLKRK